MIKKLIGIIVAMAVLAVIVMTVLHRNNFQSMLLQKEVPNREISIPQSFPSPATPVDVMDSVVVETVDSI